MVAAIVVLAVGDGVAAVTFAAAPASSSAAPLEQPSAPPPSTGEIRAELESARTAAGAARFKDVAAHVHRARDLAAQAGLGELADQARLCRAGVCYLTALPLQLSRALALLDELDSR